MQSRFLTAGVWVLVALGVGIGYLQWQQLSVIEEMREGSDRVIEGLADVADALEAPLLVNISEVSVNSGVEGIDGGFIQIAPLMLLDEDGQFDQFIRIPVSLSEPVDVRVGDEVDVWVTGGYIDTGN